MQSLSLNFLLLYIPFINISQSHMLIFLNKLFRAYLLTPSLHRIPSTRKYDDYSKARINLLKRVSLRFKLSSTHVTDLFYPPNDQCDEWS